MTNKAEILDNFGHLINWLSELESIDDALFTEPIAPGKWSIGAIVAHFMVWDEFMEQERVPFIGPGKEVTSNKVDVEEMNQKAINLAKKITKSELIAEVIKKRKSLIEKFQAIEEEDYQKPFSINGTELTLAAYINDLTAHDQHHEKQIKVKLNS